MGFIKLKLPMSEGMSKAQREEKLALYARTLVNGGDVKEISRQELKDDNGNISRIDVTIINTYSPSGQAVSDNYGK